MALLLSDGSVVPRCPPSWERLHVCADWLIVGRSWPRKWPHRCPSLAATVRGCRTSTTAITSATPAGRGNGRAAIGWRGCLVADDALIAGIRPRTSDIASRPRARHLLRRIHRRALRHRLRAIFIELRGTVPIRRAGHKEVSVSPLSIRRICSNDGKRHQS